MILVVLGTWQMPFARPLIIIEKLIKDKVITEKVIVQSGNTLYNSNHMEIIPFFDPVTFEKLYEEAELIICQAGIGSILLGLQNNKKVIGIARKQSFNEHIDDHQEDILELFSKQNFVLRWDGNDDLVNLIKTLPSFTPSKYPFRKEQISSVIIKFIS